MLVLVVLVSVRHFVRETDVAELRAFLGPGAVQPIEAIYLARLDAPIRRVLADYSILDQNVNTKTRARISRRARELTLEDKGGELVASVAPKERVPLVIRAGRCDIWATSATVWVKSGSDRASDDDLLVGVLVGSAEVRCPTGGIRRVALRTGDLATFGRDRVRVDANSTQELARRTAWRRSQIWLAGETLGQAVAEFNRYNARKIVITDRQTASIRVGGRFFLGEVDKFVRGLEPLNVSAMTLPRAPRSRDVIVLFGSKRAAVI